MLHVIEVNEQTIKKLDNFKYKNMKTKIKINFKSKKQLWVYKVNNRYNYIFDTLPDNLSQYKMYLIYNEKNDSCCIMSSDEFYTIKDYLDYEFYNEL